MVTITVCVGSSCYVRGSQGLAETFDRLIQAEGLGDRVQVTGAFCMEQCSMGISVRVGERVYPSVQPGEAETFFRREVVSRLAVEADQ